MASPWKIFYFLSTDPVLNPDKNTNRGTREQKEQLDSLDRKLIRQLLKLWHGGFLKLQEYIVYLEKDFDDIEKSWARRHAEKWWLLDRIKDHLPDGVYAQALMDLEVQRVDPDFSFTKWYGEHHWHVDAPVPDYYAE